MILSFPLTYMVIIVIHGDHSYVPSYLRKYETYYEE